MKPQYRFAILMAALLMAILLLIETALGYLDIPRFYKRHSLARQFHHILDNFYVNLTSADIKFIYDGNPRGYFGSENEVYHRTNTWGFRGDEFAHSKPAGTYRIIFIGDSFTFGEGVHFEDTYPEKLKQKLTAQFKNEQLKIESYNFGVGGYNTSQEIQVLKTMAMQTQPDMIVLGYATNDTEAPIFYYDSKKGDIQRRDRLKEPRVPGNLFFKSRIVALTWQFFTNRKNTERALQKVKDLYRHDSRGWQSAKQSLREFTDICREADVPCYVLCFPLLYQLNDRYPLHYIPQMVEHVLNNQPNDRVHFIDLFPYLKGMKDTDLWVHPTDQHPNEIVHEIAAKALAEAILEHSGDFFPQPAPRT